MKQNKRKCLAALTLIFILVLVCCLAGCAAGGNDAKINLNQQNEKKEAVTVTEEAEELLPEEANQQENQEPANTQTNQEQTDEAVLEEPQESQKPKTEDAATIEGDFTCSLMVFCDVLLEKIDDLKPEKANLVPADGIIFYDEAVTVFAGESVFDVLQREMKENKIHLDFVNTPGYNSVYIKGIANIYEFDCGAFSGWLYLVNDVAPNVGASAYFPQVGDVIKFVYSAD